MSNPLLAALLLALGRGSAGGHKTKRVGKLAYVVVTALWQLGIFFADVEHDPAHNNNKGPDTRDEKSISKYHVTIANSQDNQLNFGDVYNNYYTTGPDTRDIKNLQKNNNDTIYGLWNPDVNFTNDQDTRLVNRNATNAKMEFEPDHTRPYRAHGRPDLVLVSAPTAGALAAKVTASLDALAADEPLPEMDASGEFATAEGAPPLSNSQQYQQRDTHQ